MHIQKKEHAAYKQKKGNGSKYGREDVGESEKEEERGNEKAEVQQGGRERGEEGKERRDTRVGRAKRVIRSEQWRKEDSRLA